MHQGCRRRVLSETFNELERTPYKIRKSPPTKKSLYKNRRPTLRRAIPQSKEKNKKNLDRTQLINSGEASRPKNQNLT